MQQYSATETTSDVKPAAIQAKLTIGDVSDPLEHEADSVADRVISMSDPVFSTASETNPSIQRKCSECEEEEMVQRQPLASFIQRKESGQGLTATSQVSAAIADTRGAGSPMPTPTK